MRSAFAGCIAIVTLFGVGTAAADEPLDIADDVPLFCLDSTNVHQPFVGTNLGQLKAAFVRQFGWPSSVYSTSPTTGYLVFSASGEANSTERFVYDVTPFNSGLSLLKMRVRLQEVVEDNAGTEMCGKTWGIVNTR